MAIARSRGNTSKRYRKAVVQVTILIRKENFETGITFVSEEVAAPPLSVLCDTIDATDLSGA